MENIEIVAKKAYDGSQQVAATPQEQLTTCGEIVGTSQSLAYKSEELRELVKQFKVPFHKMFLTSL